MHAHIFIYRGETQRQELFKPLIDAVVIIYR